jgi:hypothetical protein
MAPVFRCIVCGGLASQLPVPDVMGLVYESGNSNEKTNRFTSFWLDQAKNIYKQPNSSKSNGDKNLRN